MRPALLMQYVRINAYFYGKKHNSSGLYIIQRQDDEISGAGYKTTLKLLRVGKDNDYSEMSNKQSDGTHTSSAGGTHGGGRIDQKGIHGGGRI